MDRVNHGPIDNDFMPEDLVKESSPPFHRSKHVFY